MPSYVKSKYSKERSQEIAVEAFSIVANSKTALTLTEIQNSSMVLTGTTTQKISRSLAPYVEMGIIGKTQKDGRVAYAMR